MVPQNPLNGGVSPILQVYEIIQGVKNQMSAFPILHKISVYISMLHDNFCDNQTIKTIVFLFSQCFWGSKCNKALALYSVNMHNIFLCKQFIELFRIIYVYFIIQCLSDKYRVDIATGYICGVIILIGWGGTLWSPGCRGPLAARVCRKDNPPHAEIFLSKNIGTDFIRKMENKRKCTP